MTVFRAVHTEGWWWAQGIGCGHAEAGNVTHPRREHGEASQKEGHQCRAGAEPHLSARTVT